jgi:hypothetical protein
VLGASFVTASKNPAHAGFFKSVLGVHCGGIDVWEMMFHLLGQVLRITNPVARFAGAGGFVMAQVLVQRLYEFDALTE